MIIHDLSFLSFGDGDLGQELFLLLQGHGANVTSHLVFVIRWWCVGDEGGSGRVVSLFLPLRGYCCSSRLRVITGVLIFLRTIFGLVSFEMAPEASSFIHEL